MFMLCLHFFYAFVFRSMLVCLDLVSCILVMLQCLVSICRFVLISLWGLLVCLVVSLPFVVCLDATMCRSTSL